VKRFGLRQANQDFARLIRTVRTGEEVMLLDRGRPLARIVRVAGPVPVIQRLEAQGLLLPCRKPGPLSPFRPSRIRRGLSHAVLQEREERG
jgi:antitoxin (DNA-binding transcriptional repressor) of toxin-antitoxin stability system